MKIEGGWIKIHRQVVDNPVVMKDADHMALWFYLLLKVAYEGESRHVYFKGEKITLKPGQITTGRQELAKKLSVSEMKVQRMLACFESEHQIEQKMSNNCRLITVKNWDKYQKVEQRNEQRMNNQRTSNEQPVNTNKELKNIRREEYKNYEGEGATPKEEAIAFFQDEPSREALILSMAEKTGAPEEFLRSQVREFMNYWTEKTPDGRRQKWQTMDTFEVKRRLTTWLSRAQKFPAKQTYTPPKVTL